MTLLGGLLRGSAPESPFFCPRSSLRPPDCRSLPPVVSRLLRCEFLSRSRYSLHQHPDTWKNLVVYCIDTSKLSVGNVSDIRARGNPTASTVSPRQGTGITRRSREKLPHTNCAAVRSERYRTVTHRLEVPARPSISGLVDDSWLSAVAKGLFRLRRQ